MFFGNLREACWYLQRLLTHISSCPIFRKCGNFKVAKLWKSLDNLTKIQTFPMLPWIIKKNWLPMTEKICRFFKYLFGIDRSVYIVSVNIYITGIYQCKFLKNIIFFWDLSEFLLKKIQKITKINKTKSNISTTKTQCCDHYFINH